MKKIIYSTAFILCFLLILPLSVLGNDKKDTAVSATVTVPQKDEKSTDYFRIYNTETKKITNIPVSDYIFGVVAAEMPALYENEALKAQAVAAYTFACYRREKNKNKDYDITTDYTADQAFITRENALEKWGENSQKYAKKIEDAVSSVLGIMLTYDGSPALTAYHAVSSGNTENAKDIWGGEVPYLKAVACTFDKLAPNYKKQVNFTPQELTEKLKNICSLSGQYKNYIGDLSRTKSGTVKEITICKKKYSGAKIQKALNLASANFNVTFKDNIFTFTTYGYGHGVGMSQYGANCLAKQGYNYKEILNFYYNGCEIKKEG